MSNRDTQIPCRCPSPNTITLDPPNSSPNQNPNQDSNALIQFGPIAIFWDIENCSIPKNVRPEDVALNIRNTLQSNGAVNGPVTCFSAYGDFNAFPPRIRQGCQRTGIKLIDVPSGKKDAADKAILMDMFLFALDNKPPSTILLISGDVDFAPALHVLGQRGYTIILVIPSRNGVSSALCNAGKFVWDWNSVIRGESFVPRSSRNDVETVIVSKVSKKIKSAAKFDMLRSKDYVTQNPNFGFEWYASDEVLEAPVISTGSSKLQQLRNTKSTHNIENYSGPIKILQRNQIDNEIVKEMCHSISSSSEDIMDHDGEADDGFDGLKKEVQELIVCYGYHPVPLHVFESFYVQRYKKSLDFEKYGVVGLEELIEKVKDVVELIEDKVSKHKFVQLVFSG